MLGFGASSRTERVDLVDEDGARGVEPGLERNVLNCQSGNLSEDEALIKETSLQIKNEQNKKPISFLNLLVEFTLLSESKFNNLCFK